MTNKPYLERRRRALASRWNLTNEVVVVGAGEPIGKPGGADQTYPFLPHQEYFYLADRRRPGSVLAFDPLEGWVDFVPPISQDERLWEGGGVTEGVDVAGLGKWLEARRGRPIANLGSPVSGVQDDPALRERLRFDLFAVRRPKDEEELRRMRLAAAATVEGYKILPQWLRAGNTERRIQVELEAQFFRAGGDTTAYGTIVGSGPNSAVLHFEPSSRVLADGELVLVDAGAEVQGYACDVTRTYAVDGRFRPEHRDLYAMLLEVQEAAVAGCRVGVEFKELHLAAARKIAEGLARLGYLRGSADELVETGAAALFFPHGLGHLVGLGVRDASGYLPGRQRSTHPQSRFLRQDFPLGENFVTTIEPGVYFIPAMLDNPAARDTHAHRVNWERVDRMKGLGGFRIEDNVLVTKGEPEVLTRAIPKRLEEIETK